MPLYEYRCQSCGHLVEVIQKFSDEHLTECPQCKGTLERLFSAPAIQFKGSGWYITDYARKKEGGTDSSSEKKESSESSQKKEGSESKESPSKKADKSSESKTG